MRNNFTLSDFYCTNCGKKGIPIARKNGQQRGAGHLKKIFCIYCGKDTNHAEVRPFGSYTYESFLEEYELGRFVEGNKKPIEDLFTCTKLECKCNRNGKCWNSKNDYECEIRQGVEV